MPSVRLPDGSSKDAAKGTTVLEFARSIGSGLAKAVLAGRVDGKLVDLRSPILKDCSIEIVTNKDPEANDVVRHSAEHVMADAVKQLWPEAQIDVGRTDHSEKFQYDFKVDRPFTPEDLDKIEKKMLEIIKTKAAFTREVVDRKTAKKMFKEMGELLKVSRIDDIPDGEDITIFRHGSFVDLCRGPHVQSTSQIGAIKLFETSASYWRGDESNEVLQRIYGTAFGTKKELDDYLAKLEEARRRDHRRIGKDLDLFSVSDDVGPGLILWHPKGATVRYLVEEFWRKEHFKAGYQLVYSPHLARRHLWETSGHTDFYKDNMFAPMEVEGQPYLIKPMNCPFHIQIYKSALRSYRDLPIRYAELGTVYRYERSGVLHGLLRVRGFTQDDAHLFVTPELLDKEIEQVLEFVIYIFKIFGFSEYDIFLSTRPPKSVGSNGEWDHATAALRKALEKSKLPFVVDPGEGVFYGPKIDIKVKDSLGRVWQCGTIQVDFNLPARFHLEFVDRDGRRRAPIMVHRALLGSMERFLGCLVEHYVGAFPLWLSPIQAKVLPITDEQQAFGEEVRQRLASEGFRVESDLRGEKLGLKIREAQLQKVPYMVIVGAEELANRTLALRKRTGEQTAGVTIDEFVARLHEEEKERI
ncbi:MAG TPA: threonine--tRNA ligase [Bdellovibrionota bacterium]|nr:threonine--tRNA ligase [Bdellovibrionota bacterium]